MADSKPSFDITSKVVDLILGAALGKITDKAKRSEKVIQILKQVGLSPDSPPADDFDGVFAYTLVFYGVDKPKAILEFFRHPFIKSAFRQSFETRDPSFLEEESENFLDWSPIAKELLSTMDYDPRQEFAAFREQFITSAKLTRNVQDILVDQTLEDISEEIQELPTKEELSSQLSSLQVNIIEAIAVSKRQDREPPFRLPPIDLSKFTGREKEIKDLENLIFNQDGSRVVGIVGLTGTGGMGRTALAACRREVR